MVSSSRQGSSNSNIASNRTSNNTSTGTSASPSTSTSTSTRTSNRTSDSLLEEGADLVIVSSRREPTCLRQLGPDERDEFRSRQTQQQGQQANEKTV